MLILNLWGFACVGCDRLCCDCTIAAGGDQCVAVLGINGKYLPTGYPLSGDQRSWFEGGLHGGRGKSELSYQVHPGSEITGTKLNFSPTAQAWGP